MFLVVVNSGKSKCKICDHIFHEKFISQKSIIYIFNLMTTISVAKDLANLGKFKIKKNNHFQYYLNLSLICFNYFPLVETIIF